MSFKEAVSQRIYQLCDEYNYTPNKLAELSAIPPTTFRSLLANKVNNPSSFIIYKVCRTLNIEMKDFFNSELFNYNNLSD